MDMIQTISKNHGLAGGHLDATQHIMAALPRLLSGKEICSVREQMAQMAERARIEQKLSSTWKN